MFLIDNPFKGCQGRSNHSSIVHTVSYFAFDFNDTACIVHAVSLTPNAFLNFLDTVAVLHVIFTFRSFRKFYYVCGVNDATCILKNSNIFANSNLYSKRLWPP
jgi:hypothetical protein